MSSKKGTGTVKGNKDSISKRLGIKLYGGEKAGIGNILIRQKGSKFHPGEGVKRGSDFTLFAIKEGKVQYKKKLGKKIVSVI